MRLMDEPDFRNKNILLIDKDDKTRNDRTWCFWEKEPGYFENLVFKSWDQLVFKTGDRSLQLDNGSYQYKMIRSGDFYQYCMDRIRQYPNIEFLREKLLYIDSKKNDHTIATTDNKITVEAEWVFSSIGPTPKPVKNIQYLLQHFKGIVVETTANAFNPSEATLMDFTTQPHHYPAAFYYLLPLRENKALVEYTVFSREALSPADYDQALNWYLTQQLKLRDFKVLYQEYGEIPMTNYRFPIYENEIFYIGAAGGQTKPSSGYTFSFIQKQSEQIARALVKSKSPFPRPNLWQQRYRFYDSILLRVLSKQKISGEAVFETLFSKVPAHTIFQFLDNESSFTSEWKIMNSMPRRVFLPAAIKEWLFK